MNKRDAVCDYLKKNYMDWKAELITEAEYNSLCGKTMEIPVREVRDRGDAR